MYPTRLETTLPLQKSSNVGVPIIPYFSAILLFSSFEKMLNLANFSFPEKSFATSASSGSSLLHQTHASCQKSTSTVSFEPATWLSQSFASRSIISFQTILFRWLIGWEWCVFNPFLNASRVRPDHRNVRAHAGGWICSTVQG